MNLYNPYMVPYTIPLGYYNFPRNTNILNFSMKFSHLEKIVNLMKDLKYEHKSTFTLYESVILNFRDRYRKPDVYSKNSSSNQFSSSNSQKMTLWCKKKIITHPDGFVYPMYDPPHYCLGKL